MHACMYAMGRPHMNWGIRRLPRELGDVCITPLVGEMATQRGQIDDHPTDERYEDLFLNCH